MTLGWKLKSSVVQPLRFSLAHEETTEVYIYFLSLFYKLNFLSQLRTLHKQQGDAEDSFSRSMAMHISNKQLIE